MKRLVIVAIALLAACHQSAVPNPVTAADYAVRDRCDSQLADQEELIGNMGGWLRCDPSYESDEQSHCPPTFRCSSVVQWNIYGNGVRVPAGWEWANNLDGYRLQLNAWLLVCEIYDYKAGLIPDYYLNVVGDAVPANIEQQCFSYAVGQAA